MTSWDVAALTVHLGDYNIRTDYEVQHVSRRVKRLVRHKGFDFSTLVREVSVKIYGTSFITSLPLHSTMILPF